MSKCIAKVNIFVLIMFFTGFFTYSQTLNIVQSSATAGDIITIELQSPPSEPFINRMLLFNANVVGNPENYTWPLDDSLSPISSFYEQAVVMPGELFTVNFNTLNMLPGTYYIQTELWDSHGYVYDSIQINPPDSTVETTIRDIMCDQDLVFALFTQTGALMTTADSQVYPTVSMDTVYILAVNLNELYWFFNSIHIDYCTGTPENPAHLYNNFLKAEILRDFGPADGIKIDPAACEGVSFDPSTVPAGITLIYIKTPAHMKYYEYDGVLDFHFTGNSPYLGSPVCTEEDIGFKALLDDSAAADPLIDFYTYNDLTYPGQDYRDDYPFDSFHIRLVRFGHLSHFTETEVNTLIQTLEENFSIATKGYFKLYVDEYLEFDYIQPGINENKIKTWYSGVPKTSEMDYLDVDDPDELYLAALLYYQFHNELQADMMQTYTPPSESPLYTVYYPDGGSSMGCGVAEKACLVRAIYLFYNNVLFTTDENGQRTYHFDPVACYYNPQSASEFIQVLWNFLGYNVNKQLDVLTNVTLHEFGHTLWRKRTTFTTGDIQTILNPYSSDWVFASDAEKYMARFEYMSYQRIRYNLVNMTYGDAFLERLLTFYARPEVSLEFISHQDTGDHTIVVQAGEEVEFTLSGYAPPGLAMLWYFNTQSPVPLEYGTPEKFQTFNYTIENRRKKDAKTITFTLTAPGTYEYACRARDLLQGTILWQNHQSDVLYFHIIVEE